MKISLIDKPRTEAGEFKKTKPKYIVIHGTTGGDYRSSLSWMTRDKDAAYAQLLLTRAGQVYGIAPEGYKAWHAGHGKIPNAKPKNPNDTSIGIEVCNWGRLNNDCTPAYPWGEGVKPVNSYLKNKISPDLGGGLWEALGRVQLNALCVLIKSLCVKYAIPIDDEHIFHHCDIDDRVDRNGNKVKTDLGAPFPLFRPETTISGVGNAYIHNVRSTFRDVLSEKIVW